MTSNASKTRKNKKTIKQLQDENSKLKALIKNTSTSEEGQTQIDRGNYIISHIADFIIDNLQSETLFVVQTVYVGLNKFMAQQINAANQLYLDKIKTPDYNQDMYSDQE